MRPIHPDKTVQLVPSSPRIPPEAPQYECVDEGMTGLYGHRFVIQHRDRHGILARRVPELHKLYSFTHAQWYGSFVELEPWA